MSYHKDETGASVHVLHALTYANSVDRVAAAGLIASDVGKLAKQTDTGRYYLLVNHSPVTWSEATSPTGGGSGINYITNTGAENDAANWSAYADAAAATPADGDGAVASSATGTGTLTAGSAVITAVPSTTGVVVGQLIVGTGIPTGATVSSLVANTSITMSLLATANGSVAWTVFSVGISRLILETGNANTTPLRTNASFLVTKEASNKQGHGVSIPFTIDYADLAQVLSIEFDYAPLATFTSGDLSDLRCYIYDVTNGAIIQPTPFTIQGGTGRPWPFRSSFQASSNSTSYRLILHIATTSTFSFSFKFDNVRIGPQPILLGAPISEWTAYTPGGSFTNTTRTGFWRRAGDSMEIQIDGLLTGTPGAVIFSVNLPSGYSIDTSKLSSVSTKVLGLASASDSGTAAYAGQNVIYASTTSVQVQQIGASATWTQAIPYTWAINDTFSLLFEVPIAGWGSSVVMSQDTDTRVVAARYQISVSTANAALANGAEEVIDFDTKADDSHNVVTVGASWKFTAPVAGRYRISTALRLSATAGWAANEVFYLRLRKNGSVVQVISSRYMESTHSSTVSTGGSTQISLNAGDYIDVLGYQDSGGAINVDTSGTYGWIDIERISGPATIAASERVNLFYSSNAGGAKTASVTDIDWSTRTSDSHGAWSGTVFTAPRAGFYLFQGMIRLTAPVTAQLLFFLNSVSTHAITDDDNADFKAFSISYQLRAGDTVSIRTDTNLTLSNGFSNWIAISSQ